MLSKEKQKAIIEAMLFVSTEPVPLSKMVRKLKQVLKKDTQAEEELHSRNSLRATMDQLRQTVANDTLEKKAVEEANSVEIHTEETRAEAHDVIDVDALKDQTFVSDSSQLEDEPQEDASTDVMQQLLNKQKELEDDITNVDVKAILSEISEDLAAEDHGVELVVVAKGYQLRTKQEISECLKDEKVESPTRLTPPSLETLAIVAYEQPVTRQRIEEIRGVDSGGVLKTLLEKGFIRVVGRSDELGKPLVYGSSNKFLEIFSLKSLKELPTLEDYHSLQLTKEPDATEEETDQPDTIIDFAEEIDGLSEAEQAIMDDLNSSLKNLREVEKGITAIQDGNKEPILDETAVEEG